MKGKTPFHAQIVHQEYNNPNPTVQYIETVEVEKGKGKNKTVRTMEVNRELKSDEYNEKFPLPKHYPSLQEMLDAGIPLTEVPTHLYDSTDPLDVVGSQSELLARVENHINNKTLKTDE